MRVHSARDRTRELGSSPGLKNSLGIIPHSLAKTLDSTVSSFRSSRKQGIAKIQSAHLQNRVDKYKRTIDQIKSFISDSE